MARRKRTTDISAAVAKLTAKFTADLQAIIENAAAQRSADAIAQLGTIQDALQNVFGKTGARSKAGRQTRTSPEEAKEAVLAALKAAGEPIGSGALQKATGLSAPKLRATLSLLHADQMVGRQGKKRATVYFTADTQPGEPKAPSKPSKPKAKRKPKGKAKEAE